MHCNRSAISIFRHTAKNILVKIPQANVEWDIRLHKTSSMPLHDIELFLYLNVSKTENEATLEIEFSFCSTVRQKCGINRVMFLNRSFSSNHDIFSIIIFFCVHLCAGEFTGIFYYYLGSCRGKGQKIGKFCLWEWEFFCEVLTLTV